jgi:hypothetical protein
MMTGKVGFDLMFENAWKLPEGPHRDARLQHIELLVYLDRIAKGLQRIADRVEDLGRTVRRAADDVRWDRYRQYRPIFSEPSEPVVVDTSDLSEKDKAFIASLVGDADLPKVGGSE